MLSKKPTKKPKSKPSPKKGYSKTEQKTSDSKSVNKKAMKFDKQYDALSLKLAKVVDPKKYSTVLNSLSKLKETAHSAFA